VAALLHVRGLLAASEPHALADALRDTLEARNLLDGIRGERDQFRTAAASMLNLPPAGVTLRGVAERLPGHEAEAVLAYRQRLQFLVREVDYLNQGNALVIWGCLEFVQQAFTQLLGCPPAGGYTAAGLARAGSPGSTWQCQG
jgi:hypothetical protein